MGKRGTRTQKLTVVLIKKDITQFADALKANHTLAPHTLRSTIGDESALYIKRRHSRAPSWAQFLHPISGGTLDLANASSSALLFVKVQSRVFAFCFGHGRTELKPDATVSGFGLKVTLNRVAFDKLRSVDARTLENGVTTKRMQTSRDSNQGAFGLDVTRDLLRQVVGEPDDGSFATKVAGSNALTIHAKVTAAQLGKKCKQLLEAFQDTQYREHFSWVDHLREVNDTAVRANLDNKLIKTIKKKQLDKMTLTATSIVDWENVECFKIAGAGRDEFRDLDLAKYVDALGANLKDVSSKILKNYKIRVQYAGSDAFQNEASVYSSLVWETRLNNHLYALVDGRWYEIDTSFSQTVTKFVKNIAPPSTNVLPDAVSGESEKLYNARAAASQSSLLLLDRKLVKPEGSTIPIEFCDLFSKSKQFIHVKRKTRSSTLSHLFSQGTVSAQLFVQDSELRKRVKDIIRKEAPSAGFLTHIPNGRPNAEEYEVVYAIVAKPNKNWPLSLPFFSQVNLMHSCKLLEGLGFKYALQLIEVV